VAALLRPEAMLAIRARLRPPEKLEPTPGRRRARFGATEVRICGVALVMVGAALVLTLVTR
jgi:hypothetical protein